MKFNGEEKNTERSQRKPELKTEDDETKIVTEITQTLDVQTFMDMFEQKCANLRNVKRTIRDTENHIQDILDQRETAMNVLHSISQDDKQRGDVKPNSVTEEDIESFSNIKNAEEKLEAKREDREQLYSDIEELLPVAQEIAEKYEDLELPDTYTMLVEEDLEQESIDTGEDE